MAEIKKVILGALSGAEDTYDNLKNEVRRRRGYGRIVILPYIGYGSAETLTMRGRVLSQQDVANAMETDSVWRNFASMVRRYASVEIPHAVVRARLDDGRETTVTASKEGYFDVVFEPGASPGWHTIALEVIAYPGKSRNPAEPQTVTTEGRIIVPAADAQFGIISDIDDTIMRTDVVNLLAMARNTFFGNARTRLPFEGVAALYQALQLGGSGTGNNPVFYVSAGAWNLYDLIADFLQVRGIPAGPILMTEWGLTPTQLMMPSRHAHKQGAIERLLQTYPDLSFIMIGDSGEKDPEIYLDVIEKFPGRVEAIYIRDVTLNNRDEMIGVLVERARGINTEMLLVKDSLAAAEHAFGRGFIRAETVEAIRAERNRDVVAPTPLEKAINPDVKPNVAAPIPVEEAIKPEVKTDISPSV